MKVFLKGVVLGVEKKESEVFEIDGKSFEVQPHVQVALQSDNIFYPIKVRDFSLTSEDLEIGDIFEGEVEVKGQNIKFDLV